MNTFGYTGKTVFVYGLGKTGTSAALALARDGAHVLVWDDKNRDTGRLAALPGVTLADPASVNWKEMAALVKSPGIPYSNPHVAAAKEAGIPVLGDIDLFFRANPDAKVIAVTGTNGKSTTTALIAHLLKTAGLVAAAGGNLGLPVMSLPKLGEGAFYVLEHSSFQLESLNQGRFDVAVFTNLSPDHLDHHGSMSNYLAAKRRIFDFLTDDGQAVISVDQPELATMANDLADSGKRVCRVSCTRFNGDENFVVKKNALYHVDGKKEKKVIDFNQLPNMPGAHNQQNTALAVAAAWPFVKDIRKLARGLKSFSGLPHRMEEAHRAGSITFINDSKATNAKSSIAALKTFENIYWIVGGRPKAEGITPCLEHLGTIKHAFLIGEAMEEFAQALSPHIPVSRCGTLETAVQEAFLAAGKDTGAASFVLLSPACSSYDQFENYEHRGDVFISSCKSLPWRERK